MSEALATRKRKLYKILDSLSCPPRTASTAGLPSPLIPTPRLNGSAAVTRTIAAQSIRHPRRMASAAKLSEYRARLGLGNGGADKRISMISTGSASSGTTLKPTTTILHKTGSSASLRAREKANPNEGAKGGPALTRRGVPAFCPWSHDEFLERMKTFAPVTSWLPKPSEEVSEVAWAKRGWSCVGVETVACGACKSRQVIDFSPPTVRRGSKRRRVASEDGNDHVEVNEDGDDHDLDDADDFNDYKYEEAFEKGLIERYSALVIEGHGSTCPWRQLACKDDIYHMPVVQREWWQRHIVTSYNLCIGMMDDIQKLNMREVGATPSADAILATLPADFFQIVPVQSQGNPSRPGTSSAAANTSDSGAAGSNSTSAALSSVSKAMQSRALTIALTGWTPTVEVSNNLLSCSACFQRIGLWLYHTKSAAENQQSTTEDDDFENSAVLDLITQHREHCPFRNAASQASTGAFADRPAWWILWQTLARWANESKRRSMTPAEMAALAEPPTLSPTKSTFSTSVTAGLSSEEITKLDRERSGKLRKLRKALGIFKTAKKENQPADGEAKA